MLPTRPDDLDRMLEEVERQTQEVRDLVAAHDAEGLTWRADPSRWSVTGQIAHLVLVNGPYLKTMAETVAAQGGGNSSGPWKHPWFSRYFANSMEPPVTRRYKTMKSMKPDPGSDPRGEAERFFATQDQLRDVIESARGLDMGRVRFGSPFFRLFRFSLGGGLALLLAHNRRHIWLANEVVSSPGFPGRS